MNWISIRTGVNGDITNPIPFDESGILVSHPYGVEYIIWYKSQWCYCYSNGRPVGNLMAEITHWCKPEIAQGPRSYHGS